MNRIDKLIKTLIGSCLLAFGLSGQAWAQVPCSSSTEGDDLNVGTVGGAASCAAWGMTGCFVRNPGDSCTAVDPDTGLPSFTVNTESVNIQGEVSWSIEYEGNETPESIGAIDVSVWEGARGGQNYPFLFRNDVGVETVSMTCNNGSTAGLHFCMDRSAEFAPVLENAGQPEVGLACTGNTATIFGVVIDVSGVAPGQGETTITVARSMRPCATTDDDVAPELPRCTDFNNIDGWEVDPSFGFAQGGQISLQNICIAKETPENPGVVEFTAEKQCDPDPNIVHGPFIDSLDPCPPRDENIIREEVSVGYEGSGYVGYSGSRRYY